MAVSNIKTVLNTAVTDALDAKEKSFIGSFANTVRGMGDMIGDQADSLALHCGEAYSKALADRHYKPLSEKGKANLVQRIARVLTCARAGQIDKAVAFTEATRKKVNGEFGKGFNYESTLLAAISAVAAGTSQQKFVADRTAPKATEKAFTTEAAVKRLNGVMEALIEGGVKADGDLFEAFMASIRGTTPAKKGKAGKTATTDELKSMLDGSGAPADDDSDDDSETPAPEPIDDTPDFGSMDPAAMMQQMMQLMAQARKS